MRIKLIDTCPVGIIFSAPFYLDFDVVNGARLAGDRSVDHSIFFYKDAPFDLYIRSHGAGINFRSGDILDGAFDFEFFESFEKPDDTHNGTDRRTHNQITFIVGGYSLVCKVMGNTR